MTEYSAELMNLLKGSNRYLIFIGTVSLLLLVLTLFIFGLSFVIPINLECEVLDINISNQTENKPLRLSDKNRYVVKLDLDNSINFNHSSLSRVSIKSRDSETFYNIVSIISLDSSCLSIEVTPMKKSHKRADYPTEITEYDFDVHAKLYVSGLELYKSILHSMSHPKNSPLREN